MIPSLLGEGGRKSSLPHLIFVSLLSCSNRYFLVRFVAAATFLHYTLFTCSESLTIDKKSNFEIMTCRKVTATYITYIGNCVYHEILYLSWNFVFIHLIEIKIYNPTLFYVCLFLSLSKLKLKRQVGLHTNAL